MFRRLTWVIICLSTSQKNLLYTTYLYKNFIHAKIIVRIINNCQFLPAWLFSRLKRSIASLKAWFWTFLTTSTFSFRRKLFLILWSRNSQFQVLRTVSCFFFFPLSDCLSQRKPVAPYLVSITSGAQLFCHPTHLLSPFLAPSLAQKHFL